MILAKKLLSIAIKEELTVYLTVKGKHFLIEKEGDNQSLAQTVFVFDVQVGEGSERTEIHLHVLQAFRFQISLSQAVDFCSADLFSLFELPCDVFDL